MARAARDEGRGNTPGTPSGSPSRALETPSRTPSDPTREGPGRAPAVGRRNLDDVRGDVRDTTRTKARRKATVAQKAARDRAGNTKARGRAEGQAQRQQRPVGERRPPGPGRARGAARAARERVPRPRRQPLPVRRDDFERLELREEGGQERLIERTAAPERALQAREIPDASTRNSVDTRHVYYVDPNQYEALRAVQSGTAAPDRDTDSLVRAGLVTGEQGSLRLTSQGERALAQLDRTGAPDDTRQDPVRVQFGGRYKLSPAQERALGDLGTFRVAREDAIIRIVYRGDPRAIAQIDDLKQSGLVQALRQRDATYLALTPAGRDVLQSSDTRGSVHTGIPRTSQARHDAAVYDAYQHAEWAIRAHGGTVRRVRLEEDLKAEIRREAYISAAKTLKDSGLDIKKVTEPERNLAIREATAPIAAAHGLPVDEEGAVIYPDMQLEVDRLDGTVGRCNVEVVTEHYSAASLTAKHSAGFQLYLPPVSSGARTGGGGVAVHSLAEELLDF